MVREPGYRLHKPTGQAYVSFRGRVFYLGKYGTPESHERYRRLKAEYLTNAAAPKFVSRGSGVSMSELLLAFIRHAKTYYADGSEYRQFKLAIRPMAELYGSLPAQSFGPAEFKTVRQWWLDKPTGR